MAHLEYRQPIHSSCPSVCNSSLRRLHLRCQSHLPSLPPSGGCGAVRCGRGLLKEEQSFQQPSCRHAQSGSDREKCPVRAERRSHGIRKTQGKPRCYLNNTDYITVDAVDYTAGDYKNRHLHTRSHSFVRDVVNRWGAQVDCTAQHTYPTQSDHPSPRPYSTSLPIRFDSSSRPPVSGTVTNRHRGSVSLNPLHWHHQSSTTSICCRHLSTDLT